MRIPHFKGLTAQLMRIQILTRLILFLKSCLFSNVKIGLSRVQLRSTFIYVVILSVQLDVHLKTHTICLLKQLHYIVNVVYLSYLSYLH